MSPGRPAHDGESDLAELLRLTPIIFEIVLLPQESSTNFSKEDH